MKLSSTAIALSAVLALAGCDNSAVISPEQQMGPDPVLPAAQNFLMPPMQVPKGVGWQQNQMPKVAEGLKIDKVADGLLHPRQLLTLPNGDVLVVEANGPGTEAVSTPKQLIAGLVKGQSGKGGKGGNRITLLRPTADGRWEKHVFLEGLDSPFGVQLIGNTLYVANTGNIMQYAYQPGETRISDAGKELADLPDTINHHWTKALLASPDGKKLYVGVGSNSNITENGLAVEYRRAPCWKWTPPLAPAVSSPAACATRPGCSGNRTAASCGRSSTSVTRSAPIWCRTT